MEKIREMGAATEMGRYEIGAWQYGGTGAVQSVEMVEVDERSFWSRPEDFSGCAGEGSVFLSVKDSLVESCRDLPSLLSFIGLVDHRPRKHLLLSGSVFLVGDFVLRAAEVSSFVVFLPSPFPFFSLIDCLLVPFDSPTYLMHS